MKRSIRWQWMMAFVLAGVLARSSAHAQATSSDAGAAMPGPTSGGASSDAGAQMLTSGAQSSDDASTALPATEGPPAASVTPRPAPSDVQVAALRLLEQEVDGFLERGRSFQGSINGLLRREHDRQLSRLRAGFERQISAERDAEGEARRHAIQVFERFIELYPNDPEHTPDVMFRLAELYYDEAAYAKLEADEQLDRERDRRRAAGLPPEDVAAQPVDYRCSIVLYRNIVAHFANFRLRDATFYLLGWVLKEMGHEEESINSYRNLVCAQRFTYQPQFDLLERLAPDQDTPVTCPRIFDILRPLGPELISPTPRVAAVAPPTGDAGAEAGVASPDPDESGINRALVSPGNPTDVDPMPLPTDYTQCTPLNGANGRPSRYAGEVWYYIGDYHFDNPPIGNADLGNAYAIAAYQAAMRSSEQRRPGLAAAATPSTGGTSAGAVNAGGESFCRDIVASNVGREAFDRDTQYGAFWSRSLYKIGWSYFRMTNGYPRALQSFARLLDYYDWVGAEAAAQGNRVDTIRWIGVIFTESTWGASAASDSQECQQLVRQLSNPPADYQLPFDCAGIVRIMSPRAISTIMSARDCTTANRAPPVPGRPSYIPQDRPWTPEAYLELANDYFEQTKYFEAIAMYRIFLQLFPLHFSAPRVAERIAVSYERQRRFEDAIRARGRLADYTENTPWWNANNNHPDAQQYAERVARNSLYNTAITHHRNASAARNESVAFRACAQGQNAAAGPSGAPPCTPAHNPAERQDDERRAFEALTRSNTEYNAAIEAYGQFIRNYPYDEAAYEFRYNRGEALFWAGRYADAAQAYAEVRDSNENDQFLAPAAFRVVQSLEQNVRTLASNHQLDACLAVRAGIPARELRDARTAQPLLDEAAAQPCETLSAAAAAPQAAGQSSATQRQNIVEINIPEPVRLLMEARNLYVARVPAALDNAASLRDVIAADADEGARPPFRAKFAYLNARTMYRYGHSQDAETRYRQLLTTFCNDATISAPSFADLYNLLLALGRDDDREALAQQQSSRTCAGVNTTVIREALQNRQFRLALATFERAQSAQGAEQIRLYEQAANMMRESVESNRNHPEAPLALFYTALAYERTNRFDTATQMYIRVTQEFNHTNVNGSNPPRPLEGEPLAQRINILELSNFRAAVNSERTFDFDNAVRFYNNVVTDTRFGPARDHAAHIHDALSSVALIHTNLGRWTQARDAWRAFEPRATGDRERALAHFRVAEMPFRGQEWQVAIRSFQDYRRSTPMSDATAEYHVQAQYNVAQAYRSMGNQDAYRRELRNVAAVYRSSHARPASRAAGFAAEALYLDLDARVTTFVARTLTRGTGDQLAAQIRSLSTELDQIDAQTQEIFDLQGGEFSIGALVRRGDAHEYLATQEVRIGELLQLSRQQTTQLATAERSAVRLDGLADRLAGARPDLEQRLRGQAQEIRDRIETMRTSMTTEVQTRFDHEAESQRQLAIQDFAIAIHLSRRDNIPTPFAARALEHMRLEENRPLIDGAIQHVRPEVARAARFTYSRGMFDQEAPGMTIPQQQPVATPGLAGE